MIVPAEVTHDGVTYPVVAVDAHAFAYNEQLQSVTLPSTITLIDFGAFAYCPNLNSVNLSSGLRTICDYTFYNCESLVDMPIPNTVTTIGQHAFSGCENYKFHVPEKLEKLYDWGVNMELSFPDGVVVLPDSIKVVYEFPRAVRLEFGANIPISESKCQPNIRGTNVELDIPLELEELVLPKAKFELSATLRCSEALKRIILPSIDSLYVWTVGFSGIEWLKNPGEFISMASTPPTFIASKYGHQEPGFYHCYDATLVVPAGSEEAYRNAPVWREFKTIRGDANIHRYLPGDTNDVPAIEQSATTEEEVRYFDMMGRPVAVPAPGRLYITSDGRKVVGG